MRRDDEEGDSLLSSDAGSVKRKRYPRFSLHFNDLFIQGISQRKYLVFYSFIFYYLFF